MIIPLVRNFIKKYQIKEPTIAVDAAMLSTENITQLLENNINYIVGARLGNISADLLEKISEANLNEDGMED